MKRYRVRARALQALFPFERIQSVETKLLKKKEEALNIKWKENGVLYRTRFPLKELLFSENRSFLLYMGYNKKGKAEISIRYDDGDPAQNEASFLNDYLEILASPTEERTKKRRKKRKSEKSKKQRKRSEKKRNKIGATQRCGRHSNNRSNTKLWSPQ